MTPIRNRDEDAQPQSTALNARFSFPSSGWATFGLTAPQGAIPSGSGVQIGSLTTQTDVKRTWADGSAKHMVVTANIPSPGPRTLFVISQPGGSLRPTWPSVAVVLVISGTTYTATLPAYDGSDTWLDGALCREARASVTLQTGGGSPHPLLRVWFDIRSYLGGGHVVDVAVNNILDRVDAQAVTYDVTITVGESVVYTKTSLEHRNQTRWRKRFTTGGLVEATVAPDFAPFFAAKTFPEYSRNVAAVGSAHAEERSGNLSAPKFDILQFGNMLSFMGEAGWRPEITVPYPDWLARFIVHKNQNSLKYLKKCADLSGSWSGHITNEDGTLVTITRYPNYWLDLAGRGTPHPNGPKASLGAGLGIRGMDGTKFLENAHLPQIIFPAYILTGDRFYCDQLRLWAAAVPLTVWPGDPTWYMARGPLGLLINDQVRGMARGGALIVDAAAYLPDSDPLITYFTSMVQANVRFLDTDCSFRSGGAFHVPSYWIFKTNVGDFHPNWSHSIPWTDVYVAWMAHKANRHGIVTGTSGNTITHRIGHMYHEFWSNPGWPRRHAGPVALLCMPSAAAPDLTNPYAAVRDFSNNIPQMLADMDKAFPPPAGSSGAIAGAYGPDIRLALVLAGKMGLNVAADLAALEAIAGARDDFAYRAGYYIVNL